MHIYLSIYISIYLPIYRYIKQKSLHEHFLSDSHQSFEEDVSICLVDKLTLIKESITG